MGAPVETVRVGGGRAPTGGNADLPDFTHEHAHLLFQGLYGYFPHRNNGSHMDGGVLDEAV